MSIDLMPEEILSRYYFLCRSTQTQSTETSLILHDNLNALDKLIKVDLRDIARRGSPDDFADIYTAFEYELERFREFCAFPLLAKKKIIAFGGAFSAGKSSLINALLDEKLLVTEVDPTTSLPTYLMKDDADEIAALNLFGQKIELSRDEFKTLTHEETIKFGSNIGQLLRSAFVTRQAFPWDHLALSDTPGYSKPDDNEWSERTDEQLARAQLNAAQGIIWVVSAKAGGITEDDIQFLSSLRQDIPRLVVVSRADALPSEDIQSIIAGIKRTLADRNLPVLGVYPVSSRKRADYSVEPILEQLSRWNNDVQDLTFAKNFKRLWVSYVRFIELEQRNENYRINRFNRILTMSENNDVISDAELLKADSAAKLSQLNHLKDDLKIKENAFFKLLHLIGLQVGMKIPEASEIDLIDVGGFDLTSIFVSWRTSLNKKEPDYRSALKHLMDKEDISNLKLLLRRNAISVSSSFEWIVGSPVFDKKNGILRRDISSYKKSFSCLS